MGTAYCELRELKFQADDEMTFSGYGAVFNNLDSYGDMIRPGAFKATLTAAKKAGRLPVMLLQHGGFAASDMMPVGVWTSMSEDANGLLVEGRLAPTVRGEEAYRLLKMEPRPALDGLSIGYMARKWVQGTKPKEPRRTIEEIELYEISLVTFPANDAARVLSVKGEMSKRDCERRLVRDAGFSRSEAEALARDGFEGLSALRDAGGTGVAAALRRLNEILKP